MKKRNILYIIFITVSLLACNQDNKTEVDMKRFPIVTVNQNTLYRADVNNLIPPGTPDEDSIALAKTYIDSWISDQLMYAKAEQNITNKEEIDLMVQDYRKSLVTNSYLEQLLKQQLSQTISENDLKAYYDKKKENIKLENNIIKGLFLKIPENSPQLKNFQKWYKQESSDAMENIEKNVLQSTVGYEYFYNKWVDFDYIMDNIPAKITDRRQFLLTNKSLEASDSSFVYLLNIKEYKLAGTEAPYDFIKEQLKEIFIEQRKVDFVKQVQKDLYDKAISDDQIMFYNK